MEEEPEFEECFGCDQPATMICGHCGAWQFCSAECRDEYVPMHAKVCHDKTSTDPNYVKNQLAEALVDLEENIDGRYDDNDLNDAFEVLSAFYDPFIESDHLESAMKEAHEIITDHLYDFSGQAALNDIDEKHHPHLLGAHATWQSHHLSNIAFDRLEECSAKERRDAVKQWKKRAKQMRNKRYCLEDAKVRSLRRRSRHHRNRERRERKFRKKIDKLK